MPFKRSEFLPPGSLWHSGSVRFWSHKAVNLSSHRLITEMADFMMHKTTQKNWPTLVIPHLELLLSYWYWTEIILRPASGTSGKQINFYILSFKTFRTLKDWLSKQLSLQRWSFRFVSFDIFKHQKNCYWQGRNRANVSFTKCLCGCRLASKPPTTTHHYIIS